MYKHFANLNATKEKGSKKVMGMHENIKCNKFVKDYPLGLVRSGRPSQPATANKS